MTEAFRYFLRLGYSLAVMAVLSMVSYPIQAGDTFDAIKKRGFIQCGVSDGLPGFSQVDEKGHYTGIDIDICRAIAAAVFGDANKVQYTPLTARERFTALRAKKVDLLSRNTTWTLTRDSALKLNFTGIAYYDGQGFLVNKKRGIKSSRELDGSRICMQTGTTTELNVKDYFNANEMTYTPVDFDKSEDSAAALEAGRCDALTSDQSHLYALRITLSKPEEFIVLPEVISKEPLGPVVRQGDDEWFDVVKWVLFAMIDAEELQVDSRNVTDQRKSNRPEIQRLLGLEGNGGKNLGLPSDWAFNIIKQVGNYGEIFERNVGQSSPLKIARGLNALWSQGGLHYAPPIR